MLPGENNTLYQVRDEYIYIYMVTFFEDGVPLHRVSEDVGVDVASFDVSNRSQCSWQSIAG